MEGFQSLIQSLTDDISQLSDHISKWDAMIMRLELRVHDLEKGDKDERVGGKHQSA